MTGISGFTDDRLVAAAAVSREPGLEFCFEELELVPPRGHDILVDVHAVGMCHADLAASAGDFPVPFPVVLGHEGAGVVRAVGSLVRSLVPGDRVVLTYDSCGSCVPCGAGSPTRCDRYMQRNFLAGEVPSDRRLSSRSGGVHGGFFGQSSFSTTARATERNAVRVVTSLPAAVLAPLGCGVQTGVGSVLNVAKPSPGDVVVVTGLGAVGLSAVMAATRITTSRSVVAVDIDGSRLRRATELGASAVVDASTPGLVERVRDLEPAGVDIVIECSGKPAVLPQVVEMLRPGGTAVLVGAPPFGVTGPLDIAAVVNKSLCIRGTVEGDSRPRELIPLLVSMIESGRLPVAEIVSTFPFAEINRAARSMRNGQAVKPVLLMDHGARTTDARTSPSISANNDIEVTP